MTRGQHRNVIGQPGRATWPPPANQETDTTRPAIRQRLHKNVNNWMDKINEKTNKKRSEISNLYQEQCCHLAIGSYSIIVALTSVKIFHPKLSTNINHLLNPVHARRCKMYDLLLVINSNLGPLSHLYWDTATYWPKIANFAHPLSLSAVLRGDPLRIYGKALRFLKLESSRQPMVKIW